MLGAIEPIRDARQRRIGFVGASIAVDSLRRLLDRGRALDGARAAIVDANGRIIAQSTMEEGVDYPGFPTTQQIAQPSRAPILISSR